jgi:hypothetical protein
VVVSISLEEDIDEYLYCGCRLVGDKVASGGRTRFSVTELVDVKGCVVVVWW